MEYIDCIGPLIYDCIGLLIYWSMDCVGFIDCIGYMYSYIDCIGYIGYISRNVDAMYIQRYTQAN